MGFDAKMMWGKVFGVGIDRILLWLLRGKCWDRKQKWWTKFLEGINYWGEFEAEEVSDFRETFWGETVAS